MRIDAEARAALEELVREWEECAARYGGYPEASAANQERGICAEKLADLLLRMESEPEGDPEPICTTCGGPVCERAGCDRGADTAICRGCWV